MKILLIRFEFMNLLFIIPNTDNSDVWCFEDLFTIFVQDYLFFCLEFWTVTEIFYCCYDALN